MYPGTYHRADVAVKVLSRLQVLDSDLEAEGAFMHEVKMLRKMHHPHVVSFMGVSRSLEGTLHLVMERMSSDLSRFVRDRQAAGTLSLNEKVRLCKEMALGFEYLHAKKIRHRDVKAGNVLVSAAGVVKISQNTHCCANHCTLSVCCVITPHVTCR